VTEDLSQFDNGLRLVDDMPMETQKWLIYQDRAPMCGLNKVEFDPGGLQLDNAPGLMYGVEFMVCPVGGHVDHGQVEFVIKSLSTSS
jgi:hypothetical protein